MRKSIMLILALIIFFLFSFSFTNSKYVYEDKVLVANINIEATDHIITFDSNYNLLNVEGLDIYEDKVMYDLVANYEIKNNVITATSKKDDGYFFAPIIVNLDQSNKYRFKVKVSGTYSHNIMKNSQEVYLFKTSRYEYIDTWIAEDYIYMQKSDYIFSVNQTMDYIFRFDINKFGETHSFWDLWISKVEQKKFKYGDELGILPIPIRDGYNFKGWYDDEGNKVTENTKVSGDTTLYAKWEI